MYLKAAENFWQITVEHHTYVTGGNSQSEHFHAADKIGYDATKSEYDASTTCETCNTYNMLKLSKALYQVTGDKNTWIISRQRIPMLSFLRRTGDRNNNVFPADGTWIQ